MVVFYSLLLWAGYVLFYWLIMFAFTSPEGQSLGRQAGWVGAVFVLVVVSMGIMLPSSPGFVGVFELACILALRALGAEKGMSESYALVVHAWQFVPVTLTGIAYLYFHHFSFKEIQAGGHAAVSPEAGGD
jgi:hypothetical protein